MKTEPTPDQPQEPVTPAKPPAPTGAVSIEELARQTVEQLPPELLLNQWEMDEVEKSFTCALRTLAEAKDREIDQAESDFYKAVENAGSCGACAENIACGSSMHEHEGCAIAENATLRARLSEAQADTKILLAVAQMAYRKHHLDDDEIGWNQLEARLCYSLCNVMGYDAFQAWLDAARTGKEQG